MHKLQADRYFLVTGSVRTVLYDGRAESPTFDSFQEHHMTASAPALLLIPPGVWHASQNWGEDEAAIVNFPTRPYDREEPDKYRIDPTRARSRSTGRCATVRSPAKKSWTKSSPSRVRFRPPPPLTFGFRLLPSETASTYSRPLLGARGKLWPRGSERKRSEKAMFGKCEEIVFGASLEWLDRIRSKTVS
jgi:hypothetical protein